MNQDSDSDRMSSLLLMACQHKLGQSAPQMVER